MVYSKNMPASGASRQKKYMARIRADPDKHAQ